MAAGKYMRVRRWLRRWVGNPIASVVLVVVLVGDALTLPRGWDPTMVGRAVREGFFAGTRYNPTNPYTVFVVKEPAGMRVIDPESESWDELADMLVGDDPPVVRCECFSGTDRHGIWSHVYESEHAGIRVSPMVGRWAEEDLTAARGALFDGATRSMPCWRWLSSFQMVAEADYSAGHILWTGIAHDAFAILVLSLLIYSFSGWPAWFAAHPLSRRARRRARGQCPVCGYDLRGLDGSLCPECGRAEPSA